MFICFPYHWLVLNCYKLHKRLIFTTNILATKQHMAIQTLIYPAQMTTTSSLIFGFTGEDIVIVIDVLLLNVLLQRRLKPAEFTLE